MGGVNIFRISGPFEISGVDIVSILLDAASGINLFEPRGIFEIKGADIGSIFRGSTIGSGLKMGLCNGGVFNLSNCLSSREG